MIRRSDTEMLPPRPRPQVAPERVTLLSAILEHVAMPVRIERHVVLDEDVVRAMDDHAALLTLANDIFANDATRDGF